MDEEKKIAQIQECVYLLEKALNQFIGLFENPEFIKESGRMCFRYKNINSILFQVLKCVRIVSGFNAAVVLLKAGYVQEVGVLIRTIHEFNHDIEFIQEGHEKGGLNDKQQELVDLFFSAKMQTTEELLSSMKKDPTVARREIYPTIARDLNPENPHKIQHTLKAIEEVYSGYVHGLYPHIMELYVGGSNHFCLNGMLNTSRIGEWIKYLALCVHPSLNAFIGIAQYVKLLDIAEELRLLRNKFQESEAYKGT
ncbi:MAG: hypothetical protein Q8M34_02100 [Thermodesulfovibrionales bacterium]|nr:hypothetical protein [Thermodesulfovibrionales bacterium]